MFYAVNMTYSYHIIDLKFMVSGRSYLEVNIIHVTIERFRKSRNLHTPDEYKLLIEMNRKKLFIYTTSLQVHRFL